MNPHPPLCNRLRFRFAMPCILAGLLAIPSGVCAHGPIHAEIASLTREIAAHPSDPALYLERAERWRVDGSFDAAAADLDRAEALAPGLPRLALQRGRLALERPDLSAAEVQLDRYLALAPGDPIGFALHAQLRRAQRRPGEAADDLGRAIERSAGLVPDWALDRAQLRVESGTAERALLELDAVLARHGSLVSLERAALDLERRLGRLDAALARLERLAPLLGPPHAAHLERATLFEQMGRPLDALVEWSEALSLLESEAGPRRERPAHRALEAGVRFRLAALQPAVPAP